MSFPVIANSDVEFSISNGIEVNHYKTIHFIYLYLQKLNILVSMNTRQI